MDMCEKVAEAIVSKLGPLGDSRYYLTEDEAMSAATAALQAMREPTEWMLNRALDAEAQAGGLTFPGLHWPAMIDAALEESPK